MLDKLKDLDLRYEDLESQLGDPRVYGDAEKLRQVNRELKELLPVVETYRAYQAADSRRREAEELAQEERERPLCSGRTGGSQGRTGTAEGKADDPPAAKGP